MKRWMGIVLLSIATYLGMPSMAHAQVDTKNVVNIGVNAIFFKDYVLAIQYFNTAIRNSPHYADPYYYRGLAKYSLDDYIGAELDADSALKRNPFIYDAYYLRAISRHTIGKDSLALKDYEKVLQHNPDHQGALHNSAILYIALEDSKGARTQLDRLQRFFPTYAPGYVIDGGYHLQQKDTVTAQKLFNKALSLDPHLPGAYLSLAGIDYDRGKFKEALKTIDTALKFEETSELYTNRAIIRYRLNDLRGSMADYSTAVDLDGSNEIALYNRALLRYRVGDLNNALTDLNKILVTDPDNYFAILNRAVINNEIGDYAMAEYDLNKIIKRYPSFAGAYSERARALQAQGKTTAAKKDLYYMSQLMFDSNVSKQATRQQQKIDKMAEAQEQEESNQVREEKDSNIRKFRMLVFDSQQKGYNNLYAEDKTIRGRIQDKETSVLPEQPYMLSYYDLDIDQLAADSNTKYAKQLGLIQEGNQTILVLKDLPQLNQVQLQKHMNELDSLRAKGEYSMQRAMAELTLKDYDANIATLKEVIRKEPNNAAAYFQLAVSRVMSYSAKFEQKRQSESLHQTSTLDSYLTSNAETEMALRRAMAQEAIWDLQKVTELVPDYAPAYYNVAYIQYLVGQYEEAIEAYSLAVKIDSKMGAAYFNRGLAHYAIGEKAQGDADLSTAGAHGIYRAYNIIKRMK